MTSFDNREQAFENQFAREEEMAFRITARRNKLTGRWAAEKMGLTPAETDSYATSVVQADFEEGGDHDVVRKITGDMAAAGLDTSEDEVRSALAANTIEARRQLMEAQ